MKVRPPKNIFSYEQYMVRQVIVGSLLLNHPHRDHGNSNISQNSRPTNRSYRLQTIHIFNHHHHHHHHHHHQSSIINHQSSINHHQSSIINHRSSIIDHQSSIINHQSSIINHQSSSPNPIPLHNSHPAWIEDRRNMKSSFAFGLCFPTCLGSFHHLQRKMFKKSRHSHGLRRLLFSQMGGGMGSCWVKCKFQLAINLEMILLDLHVRWLEKNF